MVYLGARDPQKLRQIEAKVIGRLAFQNPVQIEYSDFEGAFGLDDLGQSNIWRNWCDDFCHQEKLAWTEDRDARCVFFERPNARVKA